MYNRRSNSYLSANNKKKYDASSDSENFSKPNTLFKSQAYVGDFNAWIEKTLKIQCSI